MPVHHPDAAFAGIPSFFYACCTSVKKQLVSAGYDYPAHELGRHLAALVPYDLTPEQWDACLDRLVLLIYQRDGAGVITWFERHCPLCLMLVPCRRREQFVRGIYRAAQEGLLGKRSAY
jgi:hypothetical protein